MTSPVGFLGFGYAVPPNVRSSDDPIFDAPRVAARAEGISEEDLFASVRERRYLAPGERLEDLMVTAGEGALAAAGLAPNAIDRLYGYASVSEYLAPNGLYAVHGRLGLSSRAMVLPVDSPFTNFITSTVLGWEAIASGHCRNVMVNVGSGWSRNVSYNAPHALVVGDGAGAAVLGPSDRWVLVDFIEETFTSEENYHGITLAFRTSADGRLELGVDGVPAPTYQITEDGIRSMIAHGMSEPPRLVKLLLERNGVGPESVALVPHQGSRRVIDHWVAQIQPKQYLHSGEDLGDMTMASIPVTLALRHDSITTEYVVLVSPGPGIHFAALLIRREAR